MRGRQARMTSCRCSSSWSCTPPQLASNLEYVQRFRMQSRMASESAYFFTQLVRRPV